MTAIATTMVPLRSRDSNNASSRNRRRRRQRQSVRTTTTTTTTAHHRQHLHCHDITARRRNRILRRNNQKAAALVDNTIRDAHPHLWLTQDNLDVGFQDVLESVRNRRSLTEISIYNIVTRLTCDELSRLYDTIASSLPLLTKFSVWTAASTTSSTSSALVMTGSMVTNILSKARGLEYLSVNNVEFGATGCVDDDVAPLADAILSHASLKTIVLDNVRLLTPNLTLDRVCQAIATNPRMESLRISTSTTESSSSLSSSSSSTDDTTTSSRMMISKNSLVRLCQATNLKELCLWGVQLDDDAVQSMARALQWPTTTTNSDSRSCTTSKLQKMSLRNCGPHLTHKGYESLVEMLQGNFQLKSIHLDDMSSAVGADHANIIQWRIDFYLYLNNSGVRQLLLAGDGDGGRNDPHDHDHHHTATRTMWLEALACHSHDLDVLFYLLEESGSAIFLSS